MTVHQTLHRNQRPLPRLVWVIHPMMWEKPSLSRWSCVFLSCIAFCDQVIHEFLVVSKMQWFSFEPILQMHQSLHSLFSVVWHIQTLVPKRKRHNIMFTSLCYLLFSYPKESPVFAGNFFCLLMTLLLSLIVLVSLKSFLYIL